MLPIRVVESGEGSVETACPYGTPEMKSSGGVTLCHWRVFRDVSGVEVP